MWPVAIETSQLFDPMDEKLITSLSLFIRAFSKPLLQKKSSKTRSEEALTFLHFFFQKIFLQKLNFLNRRDIKNRLISLARRKH